MKILPTEWDFMDILDLFNDVLQSCLRTLYGWLWVSSVAGVRITRRTVGEAEGKNNQYILPRRKKSVFD